MYLWNWSTPLTIIASLIWNGCEYFNISLGKYAPIIFGMMIGSKGNRMK